MSLLYLINSRVDFATFARNPSPADRAGGAVRRGWRGPARAAWSGAGGAVRREARYEGEQRPAANYPTMCCCAGPATGQPTGPPGYRETVEALTDRGSVGDALTRHFLLVHPASLSRRFVLPDGRGVAAVCRTSGGPLPLVVFRSREDDDFPPSWRERSTPSPSTISSPDPPTGRPCRPFSAIAATRRRP
jgi:hypothetical protein